MASKSKVYFFFDNVNINLRNRRALKSAIEGLFKKERKSLVRLNYIFCSDKVLLEINRKYLSHNYYTDIITFDLSEATGQVVGDIYIRVIIQNNRYTMTPTQSQKFPLPWGNIHSLLETSIKTLQDLVSLGELQ